jgi:hypothetical protein
MKKQFIYLMVIAFAISLASCSGSKNGDGQSAVEESTPVTEAAVPVARKKYDVKSGVITYETQMEMAGMKIPGKKMLYFDDYGMKECEETYENGVLKESFVSDGKERFKLFHDNKILYKAGDAANGVAMPFNWDEVSQSDKDAGIAKQGGKETVAGKECDTFTYLTETGGTKTTTRYAGWNHLLLSMELSSESMKSVQKAVDLQADVAVPAEKFTVPDGYRVQ